MSGQVKEKLIVTMWRGQLQDPKQYHEIYCRLTYNSQEHNTKPISSSKSLSWKQTYIFKLSKENKPLRLDFINKNDQIKEIHFAEDQVLDSLAVGHCEISIDLDNSNRGTVPSKIPILDEQGTSIGTVFLEYEILQTEVTYVVERLIDYEYMLRMKGFKLSFIRALPTVPSFYLKFTYGSKSHKEDFSFEEDNGVYLYNYPIQLYLKDEQQILIELQIKDHYKKDYRNPNTSFDSESVYSNNLSAKSTKKGSLGGRQKSQIDLSSVEKLQCILDLIFKKNGNYTKKLPVNMTIKGIQREVGSLQFNIQVAYKSKEQKQAMEVQRKRDLQLKSKSSSIELKSKKKEKRNYEPPKNGIITVNSIIGKLELFNQDSIDGKDASIELKLGKVSQNSIVLEDPGKEIIWMDTFVFKRTWEENMKFIVYLHYEGTRMPKYYTEMNMRDLFEAGRYMSRKLELKDDNLNYCGFLTVDVVYKEEQEKPKQPPQKIKKEPQISAEEILERQKLTKKEQIMERMRKRELQKRKKAEEMELAAPTFSERELLLPPLRRSRNTSAHTTLSPRRNNNISVNVYNKGGAQIFSRSPRFQSGQKKGADSFFFRPESDFEKHGKRGASIGYGDKFDFTKEYEKAPGVGRYQIPSVWDKYH